MNITLGHLQRPFTAWRPAEGRIFDFFAFDTETTDIDDQHPFLVPAYVLGAACDDRRGVFVSRDHLLEFFQAHHDVPFICHNAAFDLKVIDLLLKPQIDIYAAVDRNQVWDTLVLKRLLSLATVGHTARGESGLADCARTHLGVYLTKDQMDAQGKTVRTSFGQFLGKPPATIPAQYLVYLAHDVIATWHLFSELHERIREVLRNAPAVYGYVDDAWLQDAIQRFGPLTHHVQLKASIVMDALGCNGIGIDQIRSADKARQVAAVLEDAKERLRRRGYLPGEKGSDKAMQSILSEFRRQNPGLEMKTTASGKWSTAQEDLVELAALDDFFEDYLTYKMAEKLRSTYVRKLGRQRLYPRFGYLLETGRTYCGGGFNLQNLPREKGEKEAANTVRGCFVAGEGNVFIDIDYSQIELVVLGYVLKNQLRLPSVLARLVNSGQDVHRLIAGTMLTKEPTAVTKEERNSVKPISFGRPGGMGVEGLRKVAKNGYGIAMTTEQVQQRIQAYHHLCPELDTFLDDEVDSGLVIAEALHMTLLQYCQATGRYIDTTDPQANRLQGWLGGMLVKVLRDEQPLTRGGLGRPYTPEEIAFFWEKAQQLPVKLKPEIAVKLQQHRANLQLAEAIRNWAGRRPTFTVTGRLRANTTFCSSRNTLFQGPAADGAIQALWLVWRAGYKIVDFVHDQLVIESPADSNVLERADHIESLMKQGMLQVIPGMQVKVETVITQSLNKQDADPRYAGRLMEFKEAALAATSTDA